MIFSGIFRAKNLNVYAKIRECVIYLECALDALLRDRMKAFRTSAVVTKPDAVADAKFISEYNALHPNARQTRTM